MMSKIKFKQKVMIKIIVKTVSNQKLYDPMPMPENRRPTRRRNRKLMADYFHNNTLKEFSSK